MRQGKAALLSPRGVYALQGRDGGGDGTAGGRGEAGKPVLPVSIGARARKGSGKARIVGA